MSNGNGTSNFPPPPSGPPENGDSGLASESPTDNGRVDSSQTSGVGPADNGSPGPTVAPAGANNDQPPHEPNHPSSNDAWPLGTGSRQGSQSGQPQYGQSWQQNGQYQGSQQPGQQPDDSQQRGRDQNGGYRGGQQHSDPQQGYPGAAGYGSAQSAPGQNYPGLYGNNPNGPNPAGPYQPGQSGPGPYQTGSGPDADPAASGTGPSQATPQPAPAPGFAGSQATATRADARPERKSRLPLFITLGAVGLVIVLVLVGFLVVHNVNQNNYGPDTVAEDYVSALSKGDFAAAEKIAPSPRPEGTNLDLLSKNFTEASSTKVENAKVESSDVDGDKGTVTVSYELDGNAYNVELPAKKDGKQDLFFDKWTLTGPALNVVSLDIPAADGLEVNGVDYQAKSGTTSFAVYPGNYDFNVAGSKWVSAASDTAAVNFPQAFDPGEKPSTDEVAPTTLNLDVSPTKTFEKEVQTQVEKKLKKCFDNKNIEPKCDFIKFDPTEIPVDGSDKKLDDLAKKDTAKWDIKDMPKVKASFGADDTNTGSFFTEKPGKFNFSVNGKQAGSSYISTDNRLSVSGTVKIDGDKLSVEFFDF